MSGRIEYVCLSDMHLGSRCSILTDIPDGAEPRASEVLMRLVEALRSLLADNYDHKPELILNGDCFELALASDEISATVFQRFMELVMPAGGELFSRVRFVPGNHDHHLWEAAREAQYAAFLERRDPSDPLPHPWYATRAMIADERHPIASPLLSALLRRAQQATGGVALDATSVTVACPNLCVREGDRCVVFHHGHFIERAYQLLTTLNTKLFDGTEPDDVSRLEEGNFAWIDFFWSALGRAGAPGDRIQYVYDHLRDEDSRAALIEQVSGNISTLIRNRTPFTPLEDALQAGAVEFALRQVSSWANTLGRRAYYGGTTAVEAHEDGLRAYVERYVHQQLGSECGSVPADVTFVFGHTHRPLVNQDARYEGFERPVRVYNTGGWVHETAELNDQVGATIVIVDDALDVAAIEVFREVPDMAERYVRVAGGGTDGVRSELHERLSRRVAAEPAEWRNLVDAIERRVTTDASA